MAASIQLQGSLGDSNPRLLQAIPVREGMLLMLSEVTGEKQLAGIASVSDWGAFVRAITEELAQTTHQPTTRAQVDLNGEWSPPPSEFLGAGS